MDERLTQKLLDYLHRSEDFLLTQAPEVFQETLKYYYISNIICLCISIVFLIICTAVFLYVYFNPVLDKYGERTFLSGLALMFLPGMILLSFTGAFQAVDTLIKVTYAPRYFLIETFKNI